MVTSVGVGDPSNNWLGSSVGERFACDEVVPGSIPGLAYYFLFLQHHHTFRTSFLLIAHYVCLYTLRLFPPFSARVRLVVFIYRLTPRTLILLLALHSIRELDFYRMLLFEPQSQ